MKTESCCCRRQPMALRATRAPPPGGPAAPGPARPRCAALRYGGRQPRCGGGALPSPPPQPRCPPPSAGSAAAPPGRRARQRPVPPSLGCTAPGCLCSSATGGETPPRPRPALLCPPGGRAQPPRKARANGEPPGRRAASAAPPARSPQLSTVFGSHGFTGGQTSRVPHRGTFAPLKLSRGGGKKAPLFLVRRLVIYRNGMKWGVHCKPRGSLH